MDSGRKREDIKRITDWPDIVDDPLPITIETTATLFRERGKDFSTFLQAHREGIRYMKAHRAETIRLLGERFGHSPSLAKKIWDDYLVCMDEGLTVDFKQLDKTPSPGGSRHARRRPKGGGRVDPAWWSQGVARSPADVARGLDGTTLQCGFLLYLGAAANCE